MGVGGWGWGWGWGRMVGVGVGVVARPMDDDPAVFGGEGFYWPQWTVFLLAYE